MKRLLVAAVLATFAIFAACSSQGEGEICNVENDSDDCNTQDGLICYEAVRLNNTVSDRCCPEDRGRATHPACRTAAAGAGISDAEAPADTGPPPQPTVNDAGDAGTTTDAGDAGSTTDAGDAGDAGQ